MSNNKNFDLDRLIDEKRTVTIGGEAHEVHDVTLKESLLMNKWTQDKDIDEVECAKKIITLFLPTVNIDDLPIRIIKSLVGFLTGQSEKNEG
ncbi:hypothetical protein [Aminobacterium colombiense]